MTEEMIDPWTAAELQHGRAKQPRDFDFWYLPPPMTWLERHSILVLGIILIALWACSIVGIVLLVHGHR